MPPAQRREQLLDAALAVIERDGYDGISIDAIAREADVTRPVVYGVFNGLSELLYALLDRQEERALNQLFGALPTDLGVGDPDAYLVAAVRHLIEIVREDPHTWRPILLSGEGTPVVVRERIARDRDLVRKRIEWLLEAGLRLRGGPAIDTEMASHALIAIAEYFGRMLIEQPDQFEADRLVGGIERVLAQLRR